MSPALAPTAAPPPKSGPADGTVRTIAEAVAAMTRRDWESAAAGFLRAHAELGEKTPRALYAHAATCLHRLGRFADAERLAFEGLGPQRSLIALKSVPLSEEEIVRPWRQPASPLVTIACTTYNHERYIETAIRGFLAQKTDFPFEIAIHDDASTDGTATVIRRWQEKYPRLIRAILQTENQLSRGIRPFELLLRAARGRYIATCEGDDYWLHSGKLQRQVSFLELHPDYSCAAHNYYLYNESQLSVRPWLQPAADHIINPRQLMNITRMLWVPTLVFRKTFSAFPEERDYAPISDQFLTSYLGTFGKCLYLDTFLGSVRRENQYSMWTPLSAAKKEGIRVKTWLALVRMHERLGHAQAAADLRQRIDQSRLPAAEKSALAARIPVLRASAPTKAINE